jgi:hypothetical protein
MACMHACRRGGSGLSAGAREEARSCRAALGRGRGRRRCDVDRCAARAGSCVMWAAYAQ